MLKASVRDNRQTYRAGNPGFTLVELLVVIAIIAMLISLLLPALRSAREAAWVSQCRSNMRQLAIAGNSYAADFKGFMTYVNSYTPVRTHPFGNFPNDIYIRQGYIPLSVNYKGQPGNPVLTCPLAIARLGRIYRPYNSNTSTYECHYTWSSLLWSDAYNRRTNFVGPYASYELARPSATIYAGDGIAYRDPYPGYNSDHVIEGRSVGWWQLFTQIPNLGITTTYYSPPTSPMPVWHANGAPNILFFDGHVQTFPTPVGTDAINSARRMMTADSTTTQYPSQW